MHWLKVLLRLKLGIVWHQEEEQETQAYVYI